MIAEPFEDLFLNDVGACEVHLAELSLDNYVALKTFFIFEQKSNFLHD